MFRIGGSLGFARMRAWTAMNIGNYCGRLALSAATATMILLGIPSSDAIADTISFKEDVFPIMQIRCVGCHQPGGKGHETSGLDLRTYEGLMKGTKYGSVVLPGRPFTSNLIVVIEHRTDPEIWMPHQRKQLSKCERQTFRFWVSQGAPNN